LPMYALYEMSIWIILPLQRRWSSLDRAGASKA
jgi:hypothetical protein